MRRSRRGPSGAPGGGLRLRRSAVELGHRLCTTAPGPKAAVLPRNRKLASAPRSREDANRLARSRRPGTKAPAAPGYGLAAGALTAGRKMKQLNQLNNPGRPTAYRRQHSTYNNTDAVQQTRWSKQRGGDAKSPWLLFLYGQDLAPFQGVNLVGCRRFVEPVSPRLCIKTILCSEGIVRANESTRLLKC